MEAWRVKGGEMVPGLAEQIGAADSPMALWVELTGEFEWAYEQEPPDAALIEHIYRFAFWCLEHGGRDECARYDLPSCVVVCLYEHIPTRRTSREDMPRWFTREEVLIMKDTFSYLLDEGEFEALLGLFDAAAGRRRGRPPEARGGTG